MRYRSFQVYISGDGVKCRRSWFFGTVHQTETLGKEGRNPLKKKKKETKGTRRGTERTRVFRPIRTRNIFAGGERVRKGKFGKSVGGGYSHARRQSD